MIVSAYGENALLVDCGDTATVHRLHAALRAADLPGVEDLVPGVRTLLVIGGDRRALLDRLPSWRLPATAEPIGRLVEVPVRYDGPDLSEVAALTGLSVEEVIRRHGAPTYTVALLGFVPGFPYLLGLDPALRVPRRDTPRTQVPAGAVAIAEDQAGIYPGWTPGGWRLLGRTELTLFDAERDPPALLAPADRVRFVPA